ncbi:uncharacterized protein LOC143103147 [Alosa pseudoharengus]|uniref:uncharacterized protein LOC143103147 n=1 Tax=Alosa pseudoharengus TaxID=34774 RepID=UPI003F897415
MMKRPLDLVMTSWLCILGQCSREVAEKGVEVNCLYDAEIRKVTCRVSFHGMAECEVENATLCDMDDICIKREALTVDVMDPKEQEYTFIAYMECGVATTSVNITLPPGKLDKFEKEYEDTSPENHQAPSKPMWAILGTCIVMFIVCMVFLNQHRPRMCSGSADRDVESHNTRRLVESQHTPPDSPDGEPLSVGQEPRDTHTPLVA